MMTTNGGVLAALRHATSASHERLEHGLDVLDPALTLADYRGVLERFWAFCAPAERAATATGVWAALALPPRLRVPSLRADLLHLGHTAASLAHVPPCTELPRLHSPARAAGYLYVLEGATLGGAVIAHHLRATTGCTTDRGAAFFGGRAARTAPLWRAFTAALTRYAERGGESGEIVAGACDTFAALERWLVPVRL